MIITDQAATASRRAAPNSAMKITVWIVSALLAAFFLFAGTAKALTPWEAVAAGSMGVPVIMLKIAGVAEIIGAVGLIVPAATRILPVLTPIAAIGLTLTMIGATTIDLGLGLYALAIQTGLAGLLAAFVAWARLSGRAAVTPRGR